MRFIAFSQTRGFEEVDVPFVELPGGAHPYSDFPAWLKLNAYEAPGGDDTWPTDGLDNTSYQLRFYDGPAEAEWKHVVRLDLQKTSDLLLTKTYGDLLALRARVAPLMALGYVSMIERRSGDW